MSDARPGSGDGRSRTRVLTVASLLVALSVVGFVLALVFQWPSDFVLEEDPDTRVTLADVVSGTVTSMPLAPFVVLVVCALLARSARWFGGVALGVLALLGAVFVVGGLGEITSDNPDVPRPVLVVAGLIYVLLGAALVVTAAAALLSRGRGRTRA